MWSKIILLTEILILIVTAVLVWLFDWQGIQVIAIIVVILVLIFITGFIAIKNRKDKSVQKPSTNIEASCESMIASNANTNTCAADVSRRQAIASPVSDDSVVLEQSYFSPQIVSAVIENEDKSRDSLIENNEVPPSYEEAKHLPEFTPNR